MASCAYILTLGKRHHRYAPSAYQTCITPTQAKVLFGTTAKPKPLGCGVFACAFQHKDPDKIVKITRDPSDVAGLIQGQGLAQVPKLYASHKLTGQPRWTTPRRRTESWQKWPDQPSAFALVVEKLYVMTGAEKSKWNQRIRRMQRFQELAERQQNATGSKTTPGRKPITIGDMAKAVCPKKPIAEAARCSLRMRELNKMSADLQSRGIDWQDMHAGNIGSDNKGRWKALDLGASPTTLDTDLPELAGFKRR